MNAKLFSVIGIDDLDGVVFARCTTCEKANRAKELLEANGFEDMVDIVRDRIPIDVIEIDGEYIEL